MAVNNYICEGCLHSTLCKMEDKIVVFLDDAKKPLNIDITVERCGNYQPVE